MALLGYYVGKKQNKTQRLLQVKSLGNKLAMPAIRGKIGRGRVKERAVKNLNGSEWQIWKVRAEGNSALMQIAHCRDEAGAWQSSMSWQVSDTLGTAT